VAAEMGADVIGLQEVFFDEDGGGAMSQSRMFSEACGEFYAYINAPTPNKFPQPVGDPEFKLDGNAIVYNAKWLRLESHDVLGVSEFRSAQKATFTLLGDVDKSRRLLVVNTHLHHELDEDSKLTRDSQTVKVLDWIAEDMKAHDAVVFTGDFNAPPDEPAYASIVDRGFVSAHKASHGSEPERTFPTGLQAPTMDRDPPLTTDYVWLFGSVNVNRCWLEANTAAPHDATLYPSDHVAVVADVTIA
jgi:endonuclease/exonuclease/phosphatase family metal-dependent hydrolase